MRSRSQPIPLLSFFPFIVLLLTVIHRVFHSPAMYNVVAAIAARLSAEQQGFRDSQSAISGQRERTRANPVVRHVADHLDRHLSAAGGCAQQHLGLQEEPLLSDEPDRLAGPCVRVRMSGDALDCADGGKPADARASSSTTRTSSFKAWDSW